MNSARLRLLLWTTTAGCVAAVFGVAAWSVLLPAHMAPTPAALAGRGEAAPASRADVLPTLADFTALADMPLRRALVDPPPPQQQPRPELVLKLAGTIIEPGRNQAIVVGADGKTQIRGIGEIVASGAEILSIAPDSITVRYNGQSQVLKLAKEREGR